MQRDSETSQPEGVGTSVAREVLDEVVRRIVDTVHPRRHEPR
jgi:hypothetical protein